MLKVFVHDQDVPDWDFADSQIRTVLPGDTEQIVGTNVNLQSPWIPSQGNPGSVTGTVKLEVSQPNAGAWFTIAQKDGST